MQNRESVRAAEAGQKPISARTRSPARYRVVARLCDGSRALVCLARSLDEAVAGARQFRDAVIAHRGNLAHQGNRGRDRIAAVCTEEWVGGSLEGRWERLGSNRGGFVHVFRGPREDPGTAGSGRPHSGQKAQCVLLEQKTRKGGWRARLLGRELSGPVTNSADVPSSAGPGQVVTLRIGAMSADGGRIQFDWLPESAGPNGQTRQ